MENYPIESSINFESFPDAYLVEPANPFDASNLRTLRASVPLSGHLYSPPHSDRGLSRRVER